MTQRLSTLLALLALLALTGCPTDDPVDDDDTVSDDDDATGDDDDATGDDDDATGDDDDATGDDCGLTAQQIGDPSLEVLSSYLLDANGELACAADQDAQDTFDRYTGLIPELYRDIVAFVAIDQEASGGTDGALQDLYDENDEATGDRFIALDVTGYSTELERTIVHETGHLIFIIPASDDQSQYTIDFNAAFPPGAAYESEDFVSEYAASVPDGSEDMAESWAMYVFAGTDYAGDSDGDGDLDTVCDPCLARDKMEFFDGYPELLQLRTDILANAGF